MSERERERERVIHFMSTREREIESVCEREWEVVLKVRE